MEILKITGLIEKVWIIVKVWIKNLDFKKNETRNCFLEKTEHNELMGRKHNKVHTTLNYIEHLLILISTITGCVSISSFAYLVGIPI